MARRFWLATLGVLGLGAFAALSEAKADGKADTKGARAETNAADAAGATPILIELFTSEGCSSCPPADAVATKLERAQPVAGARVIVLAHHVDYWNSLGWPDPWSSAAATARQRSYAPLHAGAYTPQAVVDGRRETVGSRAGAIESMIAEAARAPHLALELQIARFERSTFDVTVKTPPLPADTDVLVAVVQDRGRTAVAAGENSGKTLDHTSIVRTMTSGPKARVTIPSAVNAPDGTTFSIVAFAQERASRRILGSSSARVP